MLVPLVHSVSREMFHRGCHVFFFRCADVCLSHIDHSLKVVSECADICDRVVIVPVQVHYRGKGPVYADRCPLAAADFSELICLLRIACGRYQHLPSEIRSLYSGAVSAVFQIGRSQKRDL